MVTGMHTLQIEQCTNADVLSQVQMVQVLDFGAGCTAAGASTVATSGVI